MEEATTKINSFLSFRLGEETFAANVSSVLNILEMTKITAVPQAPEYMKGVINLRGTVLPVVDTRIKFGLPEIEYTKDTCIVVMDLKFEDESIYVGSLVDGVEEVLEIEKTDILPAPTIGNKYKSDFINGMFKHGEDKFIMLLNMNKVFNTDDLVVMHENFNEEIN
ncbi:MAG: chemotaxis protein CheW [Marinilabiliales bacterium]|nr:MAG: chemotaxis protein CheW [Marinilabiliales bacterium]